MSVHPRWPSLREFTGHSFSVIRSFVRSIVRSFEEQFRTSFVRSFVRSSIVRSFASFVWSLWCRRPFVAYGPAAELDGWVDVLCCVVLCWC